MKQSYLRWTTELPRGALCLLLLVVTHGVMLGDDVPSAHRDATSTDRSADRTFPIDDAKKERVVTAAVFLLVLVVIVGVALLLGVVLWGRNVRRIARKPTAQISPGDELWYLKPDKTEQAKLPAAEMDQPDAQDPETDLP